MSQIIQCACGRKLNAPPELAGKRVRCPACKTPLDVPPLETEPDPWSQMFTPQVNAAQLSRFPSQSVHSNSGGPPGTVRCDFCHQYIPADQLTRHVEHHLKKRADGQQTDYATLPPELFRPIVSFESAPRDYAHRRCGAVTGMPEAIIKTYLTNPWYYLANRTYCCGCQKHVPLRECIWEETGEDLQSYTDRLRSARPDLKPNIFVRILASVLSSIFS